MFPHMAISLVHATVLQLCLQAWDTRSNSNASKQTNKKQKQ